MSGCHVPPSRRRGNTGGGQTGPQDDRPSRITRAYTFTTGDEQAQLTTQVAPWEYNHSPYGNTTTVTSSPDQPVCADSFISVQTSRSFTPSLRSRAQSIAADVTESVKTTSERLVSSFKGKSALKSERKAERKAAGRPPQADLLEKPGTKKIEKFWRSVEPESRRPSISREAVSLPLERPEGELQILGRVREQSPVPAVPDLSAILPEVLERYRQTPRPRELEVPKTMDSSRLLPLGRTVADQKDKAKRIKDAQQQSQTILRNAQRSGTEAPPYEFLELIGKGAFGRVYKCQDKKTGDLVAVKIVSIDEQDWSEGFSWNDSRDQTIIDFKREVSILQQLKDNNAQNVNVIHDAFDWHAQLWIVSDYCTGGSVRTLMRPFERNGRSQGLPEQFIVPIARELATAMKSLHELHIIHRDMKCANVYITEDGDIQLGDFGIVGVIDHDNTKRKTVIGTPHWMPREMVEHLGQDETAEGYGSEVDIWSYGCTIFEMATGMPPYSNHKADMLPELIETSPPRLEGGSYSPELCDFVEFCLKPDKKSRPTAEAILSHPFVKDTSANYPTAILVKLIEKFKIWELGGGSRTSLWLASPTDPRNVRDDGQEIDETEEEREDWNFSTSDDFDQEFGRRYSHIPTFHIGEQMNFEAPAGSGLPPLNTQNLSVAERIKREHSELSANRGEKYLARLYDVNDPSGYQLATPVEKPESPELPTSDLPLRNFTSDAPTRESMIEIDLDEAAVNETATSTFAMHMNAMDTINEDTVRPAGRHDQDDEDDDHYQSGPFDEKRATMEWSFPAAVSQTKRGTMEWSFPQQQQTVPKLPKMKRGTMDWTFDDAEPATAEESEYNMSHNGDLPSNFRPHIKHAATEPIGHFGEGLHGTVVTSLNRESVVPLIDLDAGAADRSRDGADISRPSTAGSHLTDATSGNPFDLDDDHELQESDVNRFSYHKQWRSDGVDIQRNSHKTMPMHARGSSLSSTESDVQEIHPGLDTGFDESNQQPNMAFTALEQSLAVHDEGDNHQWPRFSAFDSFDTSPQYLPRSHDVNISKFGQDGYRLEHGLRTTSFSARSREPSMGLPHSEIEFPVLQAPHPDAMLEDADEVLLEDELNRNLNDLTMSLTAMMKALGRHSNVQDEHGEISSDMESGFESNRDAPTEDDEVDQLTARRKPRKQEMRSSPRLP